jgi:hypothetical protein
VVVVICDCYDFPSLLLGQEVFFITPLWDADLEKALLPSFESTVGSSDVIYGEIA